MTVGATIRAHTTLDRVVVAEALHLHEELLENYCPSICVGHHEDTMEPLNAHNALIMALLFCPPSYTRPKVTSPHEIG